MQVIKYIMLFILFILSILIGRYISKKYLYRLKELEELKSALNILKTKIKFTYEPITEIYEEISKNLKTNISKIFINSKNKMEKYSASNAWEKSIDEYQGYLKEEDKQVIKTLSKLLRYNRCRRTNYANRSY